MSVADEIRALLAQRAARDYQEAQRDWELLLSAEQAYFDERLRDPEENLRLGLPEHLPEETIAILRHTQALDRIGPQKPHPKTFYDHWGVPFFASNQ